jgi:hypothetical protein
MDFTMMYYEHFDLFPDMEVLKSFKFKNVGLFKDLLTRNTSSVSWHSYV